MGGLESKQSLERENFLTSYQPLEHKSTGVFGECVIMKSNQGEPIVLKEKTYVIASQMKAERERLETLKDCMMMQENLLRIKEIITSSQSNLCSGSHKLLWAVEYHPRTLSTEFFTRRIQGQGFSEQEVWSLIKEITAAMTYFQSKSFHHGDLRPNTIFITREGVVKIGYPELFGTQTSFAQVLMDKKNIGYYLSPQLVSSLESNYYYPKHDAWRSEVFSLGVIILEVGNLKSFVADLYDFKKGTLNYDEILKELQEFSGKFSQELTELVWNMIEINEDRRPDWKELSKMLCEKDSPCNNSCNNSESANYQYRQGSGKPIKPELEKSKSNLLLQELYIREDNLSKNMKSEDSELDVTRAPNCKKNDFSNSEDCEESLSNSKNEACKIAESNEQLELMDEENANFRISKKVLQTKRISNISNASDNFVGNSFELSNTSQKVFQPTKHEFPINRSTIMECEGYDSEGVPDEAADEELRSCAYGKEGAAVESQNKSVQICAPNVVQEFMRAPETAKLAMTQHVSSTLNKNSLYYKKSPEVQAIFEEYREKLEEVRRTAIFARGDDEAAVNQEIQELKLNLAEQAEKQAQEIENDENDENFEAQEEDEDPNQDCIEDSYEEIQAVETYIDGSEYTGCLRNGKRNGKGTMKYSNGGVYIGDWLNGMMQGEGELYYPDGRLAYKGGWREEKFFGRGTIYNFCPKDIEGPIDLDNPEQIDEVWEKYQGDFYDDRKEGEGVLFFTNGECYEGQFKEDMLHGTGVLRRLPGAGSDVQGLWENNVFVKEF